jgi:N6-L-threonylcarbamoyladenine synthase
MTVLGIESSCDECAAAVVVDGRRILSNIVASQIEIHARWGGVVPEVASRKHAEWIAGVAGAALDEAGLAPASLDGVAVTSRPGLMGALLTGLSFAKSFAWALDIPLIAVDHLLAHLYAANLSSAACDEAEYPFIGLLASGGHTVICAARGYEEVDVLGSTVDDAAGEAFDKVAKHYGWGYPGGKYVEQLARNGDAAAFAFPMPKLHNGRVADVSYSGLKTAAIHQLEFFRKKPAASEADIAASFQKTAVEILARALLAAVAETGLKTIVAGGGVAANACLRERLAQESGIRCVFPDPALCGDNAAMVAALGYEYLSRGLSSPLTVTASSRVAAFRKKTR